MFGYKCLTVFMQPATPKALHAVVGGLCRAHKTLKQLIRRH